MCTVHRHRSLARLLTAGFQNLSHNWRKFEAKIALRLSYHNTDFDPSITRTKGTPAEVAGSPQKQPWTHESLPKGRQQALQLEHFTKPIYLSKLVYSDYRLSPMPWSDDVGHLWARPGSEVSNVLL